MKSTLKQLSQGAALCGIPTGIGSVDMLGDLSPGEVLPLALVLAAFAGAGVWMFRRWGNPTATQIPTEAPLKEASSEETKESQEERELINVW